jgi:hypothetical protein
LWSGRATTDGTALSGAQLDATANALGSFAYSPVAGTVSGAGTQTLSVTFTPTDRTDYPTATAVLTVKSAGQTTTTTALTGSVGSAITEHPVALTAAVTPTFAGTALPPICTGHIARGIRRHLQCRDACGFFPDSIANRGRVVWPCRRAIAFPPW